MTIIKDHEIVDPYRSFIHKSRYARWIDEFGRRETWEETVQRYVDFFSRHADLTPDEKAHVKYNIMNHKVMPSMRALMTAGEALERSHVSGYNCSFLAVNDPRAFDEALFILMNGTGLGFSVEGEDVMQLPSVPAISPKDEVIIVDDSKEGWAQAYRELIASLYRGELPRWDLRRLRPEGARLKTFGGRSSGPAPLNELFEFTVEIFAGAQGRKLSALEAHEIMCKVGSVVVVGGVRRSALISLSNIDEHDIRDAKTGEFWNTKPHLALSNNSVVYDAKPSREVFDVEWKALVASGSGERGIYNRLAAQSLAPSRRDGGRIKGTNPCAEIALRDMGLCNLTEIIVDPTDTLEDLKVKAAVASKIGTWQSTLTSFGYLRDQWRENAEEERLLGVSLTGQMGHPVLNGSEGKGKLASWLKSLKAVAVSTNEREAKRLGINPAAAVTTVKPSGTVSQLAGVASGMHPWHDPYYIRTVRGANSDPLTRFMKDAGIPSEPDLMNPERTTVFSFAQAAPENALTRSDMSAIDQLEMWLAYKTHWAEHSVSQTVSVKADEWVEVGNWVFKNFDAITGLSFLPHEDHIYQQAPYQTVDKANYEEFLATMPEKIDWSFLPLYELEDTTTGSQTLACQSGQCDVSDLLSASQS